MSMGITCGRAIIQLLEAYGVEVVFGIPGTHTLQLYGGLHGSGIRHVLTRTEQGAGFMADGYARACGKVGVCFAIAGPGLLNAATPMASAYVDSVPMLVISSATARPMFDKGWGVSHEITHQRDTTASFTALSATAHRPEDIPGIMGRAFAVFAGARPGPVHIEIPCDVFDDVVDAEWQVHPSGLRPAPHPDAVGEAAELLAKACRPAIYVGGGARHAAGAVRLLAERMAAPVATTVAGMGVLPASHPLSLGSTTPWAPTRRVLERADVVLAIGTEMAATDLWDAPLEMEGKLIRVDIDPKKLTDRFCAAVAIHADADLAAQALLNTLTTAASQDRRRGAQELVRDTIKAVRACVTGKERQQERVCLSIQSSLPEDALIFGDLTQLAYTAYRLMPLENPGRFFTSKGFGALGYALPAALGAKLAYPRRVVVAMAGDSGLLYNLQEMATAFDERIPIILIVWNNRGLGEIRDGFVSRGIEPIAASQTAPDHLKLAQAFGWDAVRATSHETLKQALQTAVVKNSPTLIEVLEADPW